MMKLAVISDIHGNLPALRACLDHFEKENCDEYLLLGDFVSDAPYPRETLDCLYELMDRHTCHVLRGNREDYMLGQKRVRDRLETGRLWKYNSASGNLLFTYDRLSGKDFEFFGSLPITFVYRKEGYPALTCCHGSPVSNSELVELAAPNAMHWLDTVDTDYMLCAHTHFPGELRAHGRSYFNSGCCGIAISDCGYAQCMILHGSRDRWVPEFLKIPYDSDRVVKDIFASGLYDEGHWFVNANIQTLSTGTDHAGEMIRLVKALAAKAGDTEAVWPDIDEKYFEEAAGILGVPEYGRGIL